LNLHFFSNFGHNGAPKGLEFPPKIADLFLPILPIFLDQLSPHCQPVFYFLIFILKKE
jgi:hypothetical protein